MFHLPRQGWEWPVFLSFWLGGLFLLYYEVHIVMKSYYPTWWEEPVVKIHLAVAAILAINIYLNMTMLLSTNVFYQQSSEKDHKAVGWKFCKKCSKEAPPRSHHCKLCDQCVLKRDHHCWFTAYCIGYQNHRYYACMIFYCFVAAVYCNIFNWQFVLNVKGGFAWTTLPSFLAPHVGLVFGRYSLYEFSITALTSVGGLLTILFTWLLTAQCQQIWGGQVQYERKKGITAYSISLHNTLNEIFGSAGLLVLLCPLIPTTLPGDGTWFPKQEKSED